MTEYRVYGMFNGRLALLMAGSAEICIHYFNHFESDSRFKNMIICEVKREQQISNH